MVASSVHSEAYRFIVYSTDFQTCLHLTEHGNRRTKTTGLLDMPANASFVFELMCLCYCLQKIITIIS